MAKKKTTLRAVITIQVDTEDGLSGMIQELQAVAAHLKMGSMSASCIEDFKGFTYNIEKKKPHDGGFPEESFNASSNIKS